MGALVVDRAAARAALLEVAQTAGAQVRRGMVTSLERTGAGYRALIDHGRRDVSARHVVIATGAGRYSLTTSAAAGLSCVQRVRGVDVGDDVVLIMVAPPATRADAPPVTVWALPGADGISTVGAACAQPAPGGSVALAATALRTLAEFGYGTAVPVGARTSGPLNSRFGPDRLRAASGLLVGDAAGLVNPFTGEGVSYAIESGLLAATAVLEHDSDADAALRRYRRALSGAFVGHFETARHAARRYHLAWRILAGAVDSDSPFFAKGRRAVLLPEGLAGASAPAALDVLSGPDIEAIGPFLLACDEVMLATIRSEWPFLARLTASGDAVSHRRIRPTMLFAAALVAGGRPLDPSQAPLAAAIELASLGALAFIGSSPQPAPPERGVDWAVAGVVLAGDFLLAQASRIVAERAPHIAWAFADWLADLTALRAARLDPDADVPAQAPFGALFEFPARIGAQLGGASADVIEALRAYGTHCGHAFAHAEDGLALRGRRTRLDTTLAAMVRSHTTDVPLLEPDPSAPSSAVREAAVREAAVREADQAADRAAREALAAIAGLPDRAHQLLSRFAGAVAHPPQGPGASLDGSTS
jgi:geranylgeranyl pyrophosphate synthase